MAFETWIDELDPTGILNKRLKVFSSVGVGALCEGLTVQRSPYDPDDDYHMGEGKYLFTIITDGTSTFRQIDMRQANDYKNNVIATWTFGAGTGSTRHGLDSNGRELMNILGATPDQIVGYELLTTRSSLRTTTNQQLASNNTEGVTFDGSSFWVLNTDSTNILDQYRVDTTGAQQVQQLAGSTGTTLQATWFDGRNILTLKKQGAGYLILRRSAFDGQTIENFAGFSVSGLNTADEITSDGYRTWVAWSTDSAGSSETPVGE